MSDNIQIVLTGDSAGAVAAIQKTQQSLQQLAVVTASGTFNKTIMPIPPDAPEQFAAAGSAASKMGKDAEEAAGMSRREWMRTGSEVMFYFQQAAGKSGEMNESVLRGIEVARQLGESFMYGGALGSGIAIISTSVGALVTELNKASEAAKKAADDLKAPFEETQKQIEALSKLQGLEAMAKQLGVTQQALEAYIKSGKDASDTAYIFNKSNELIAQKQAELADAQVKYDAAIKEYNSNVHMAADGTVTFGANADAARGYVELYGDKVRLLAHDLGILQTSADDAASAISKVGAQDQIDQRNASIKAFLARQESYWLNKNTDDAKLAADQAKQYATALGEVAKAQDNLIKSMVDKALAPSATMPGPDTWDENRKRLEAVATGTDPSTYGAKFASMFKGLTLSAKDAAAAFKDFSLFADPKNMSAIGDGWQSIQADVSHQIDMMIGKQNVYKEAVAKVWAGLSVSQKASLRELGIESASDATKQMLGVSDTAATSFAKGLGTTENIKTVKEAGTKVVNTVTTAMMDKDATKTITTTIDTMIQTVIAEFSTKDNTKLLTDAGTTIVETLAKGVGASSALSDALIAQCKQAIKDAISSIGGAGTSNPPGTYATSIPGFAAGGSGVFTRSGLVHVDAGEPYAFGGAGGSALRGNNATVVINYQPAVSLASQSEIAGALEPIVREINRRLNRQRI